VASRIAPGDVTRLFKLPVSALSALSAATGYLAWAREASWGLLGVFASVLLLACSASALNEAQEHDRDALMERTRSRPIPAGKLSPRAALAVAAVVGITGLAWLSLTGGATPALLGALAVALYNAIYTPLKRITAFAVVPGALVGGVAPAIGWAVAGGSLWDGRLLALCFFWLMWQVPHFSLLLARSSVEYALARFPTLRDFFSDSQLARVTFVWIVGTAASALLIPIFGVCGSPWAGIALAAAGAVLCLFTWRALAHRAFDGAFRAMSAYALVVIAVLVADALL